MTDDIPILQKTIELYKTFYQFSAHFPKKDRFGIGQRCEQSLLHFLEYIIQASKMQKSQKDAVLFQASVTLDLLKIFIRLMKELRIIDLKKYTILQEQIYEIGKMLGGWIKSLHENPTRKAG